ncbi:hypothetical protein J8M20_03005 [Pseudoalteromonas luteoviolacea]|uniref:hypothetical protein n=1 Tax=Pseudoalteromonas luteoviolacea TaxID=43657 RepID=UPI001B399AF1|nr:hypothetical protein [Pseudoalteromonas luteoviolacea]MBQ4810284.1 hypothetical protein [Pseudoalteromonas luteoviolacea]
MLRNESGEIAPEIFGLALCQYDESGFIYRFTCDSGWETEQDADYGSVAEAKENLPEQYRDVKANRQKYE